MITLLSTTLNKHVEAEEASSASTRKFYMLYNPLVGHRCCTVEG
jgi:hypothetical protein